MHNFPHDILTRANDLATMPGEISVGTMKAIAENRIFVMSFHRLYIAMLDLDMIGFNAQYMPRGKTI